MLHKGVVGFIFPRIITTIKVKDSCEILQEELLGDLKVRDIKLQSLGREFENMKMKDNESINNFSSIITELVN